MVEVDKDWELSGNFQEGETKVKSKTNKFEENISENRKSFFFRCEKTPLKLGTNFWDVTNLPPLKRISSRDSETIRDSRGYNKIFLVWFNIPLYLKYFKTFSYTILKFNTQKGSTLSRIFH